MKKLMITFVLSIFLSACQQQTSQDNVIHFVTEATYPPFVYQDANGQVIGLEVDILQAICQEASVECEMKHQAWDSALTGVQLGLAEGIFGGMDKTPERAETLLFTDTTLPSQVGWLLAPAHPFDTDQQLPTGTIGVQAGSLYHQYLMKHNFKNIQIKPYPSIQDALIDLQAKRLDMILADHWVLHLWQKENPTYPLIENNQPGLQLSAGYALAFNQSQNEMVTLFNQALASLKSKGIYQQILNDWESQ